jgi:hypothetical protein
MLTTPYVEEFGSLALIRIAVPMRPGYLRRNGVPYSANAVMTEFIDLTEEANKDSWLILTSSVDDPQYLAIPVMLTTQFKRDADGFSTRVVYRVRESAVEILQIWHAAQARE